MVKNEPLFSSFRAFEAALSKDNQVDLSKAKVTWLNGRSFTIGEKDLKMKEIVKEFRALVEQKGIWTEKRAKRVQKIQEHLEKLDKAGNELVNEKKKKNCLFGAVIWLKQAFGNIGSSRKADLDFIKEQIKKANDTLKNRSASKTTSVETEESPSPEKSKDTAPLANKKPSKSYHAKKEAPSVAAQEDKKGIPQEGARTPPTNKQRVFIKNEEGKPILVDPANYTKAHSATYVDKKEIPTETPKEAAPIQPMKQPPNVKPENRLVLIKDDQGNINLINPEKFKKDTERLQPLVEEIKAKSAVYTAQILRDYPQLYALTVQMFQGFNPPRPAPNEGKQEIGAPIPKIEIKKTPKQIKIIKKVKEQFDQEIQNIQNGNLTYLEKLAQITFLKAAQQNEDFLLKYHAFAEYKKLHPEIYNVVGNVCLTEDVVKFFFYCLSDHYPEHLYPFVGAHAQISSSGHCQNDIAVAYDVNSFDNSKRLDSEIKASWQQANLTTQPAKKVANMCFDHKIGKNQTLQKAFAIPIDVVDSHHWTMIFIDPKTKTIEYYDSMLITHNNRGVKQSLEEIQKFLKIHTGVDYEIAHKITKACQFNGTDCGAWISFFAQKRMDVYANGESFNFNNFVRPSETDQLMQNYRNELEKNMVQIGGPYWG